MNKEHDEKKALVLVRFLLGNIIWGYCIWLFVIITKFANLLFLKRETLQDMYLKYD